MQRKLGKFLLTERIPTIVCMLACVASVFIGFIVGYIIFGAGDLTVVYAEAPPAYEARGAHIAYVAAEEEADAPQEEEHEPEHLYVVSALNGYIVVYHANGEEVKEFTSTPVGTLSSDELKRLIYGIRIYSDEALARILQDYGS